MKNIVISLLIGYLIGEFRQLIWHVLEWCVVKIRERKK